MLTSISAASGTSTANTSTANSVSDVNGAQDRFLKLLVAQINNQDPMNPLDNAQMTSQMAQINTVSGIQQVNETLKSLSSQFAALQVLQGASMVGHDVLVAGNALNLGAGTAGGAINLDAAADKVSIDILSPSGQVVDTINLGALNSGRHDFTWDASKYTAGGTPTFRVNASMGGTAVGAATFSRDKVVSVSNVNGALSLLLKGMGSQGYDGIQAIL
jgi:flagellar basal-body rod modification protein FlgD